MATLVNLRDVLTNGGTQSRAQIDQHVVTEYADAIRNGATLPPVVVFHDGAAYWLADGFHRLHAHFLLDLLQIEADVRQGSQRDAILYSVGANAAHGLRRTNADKRRAVETLVRDEEWGRWSANEIARRCGVAPSFAAGVKNEIQGSLSTENSERTYTTKHGTVATMNTAAIGRVAAVEPAPAPGWNDAGEPIVRRDDPAQVAAFFGKPAGQAAASPAPVRVPVPTRAPMIYRTPLRRPAPSAVHSASLSK